MTSPRLLDASERADLQRVLAKFDVDFGQTFRLSMNGFGDCYIASTIYRDNGDADYLVVQGNRVNHVLPKNPNTNGMMRAAVKAVSFTRLDADPYTDIVILADYRLPRTTVTHTITSVYYGNGGKTFTLDAAASSTATNAGATTVAAARRAIGR